MGEGGIPHAGARSHSQERQRVDGESCVAGKKERRVVM